MSSKKEQKPNESKKSDKMIDPHREYLDMDTDEEDFGRQESLEDEEEISLEPEKPVFNEEDLTTLVNNVKSLTIHSSVRDAVWNESSDEIIRDYFENPSHVVLSTFYEDNKLHAALNIPTNAPKGFTYFLRSSWHVYTPENFFNTVSFGTINGNFKSCILKFMENIYAPTVLHSDEYLSFLRNDLLLNLHEFIIHLSEAIYKPMGLTILYVPKERLEIFSKLSNEINYFFLGENQTTTISDEDERKRKLVGRLEKIVWYWIRQMHNVTRTLLITKAIKNIQDKVNDCNSKHSNLNQLRDQLLNPEVRFIIELLNDLRSPMASKFEELTKHVDAKLKETSSNLMYLNILNNFCKDLNIPEDAENSVTEALLLILFIWTESSFYSSGKRIEILCQAFSSQIIQQCKEYLELNVAFESDPEMGIQNLEKCISCCDNYKIIYSNLITNVVPCINLTKQWSINDNKVFDQIDAFKQRCNDVIEICRALIVFGRCNKVGTIGSVKGRDHETYWREIENLFHESLEEIIAVRDIIFDVTKSIWLQKIENFRYIILQLENMVINLINDVFKDVKNVEEGVETIFAFQKFKKRESLKELLQNKWIQVWKIFNNEIEYCYTTAINESKEEAVMNVKLLCIFQYLKRQYSIMINSLNWVGEYGAEKCILQRCEYVLDVIDERRKMFNIYNET
ncbi:uncharacterized protein LOC117600394 [Osmia lignaria lignaria]|uniref:uncharacterized protein LOC117600394 n=1 Tax=Osmia lignaria lignaria TaxID=1437193 RepID=UPI00402B3199